MPSKKSKDEKNTKWSKANPESACDLVKGKYGPLLDACIVNIEIEAFLIFINGHMIETIVKRAKS